MFDEQNGAEEITTEGELEADTTSTNTTSGKNESTKIKIELLNGSGESALLTKATKALKDKGYNVYKTGTTTLTPKTTNVNKTSAQSSVTDDIKSILGVGNISSSVSSSSTVDITIIIGKDYK